MPSLLRMAIISKLSGFKFTRKIFYNDDWSPKRCNCCGVKGDFRVATHDYIGCVGCEKSIICEHCQEVISYWAYGDYQPPKYAKNNP